MGATIDTTIYCYSTHEQFHSLLGIYINTYYFCLSREEHLLDPWAKRAKSSNAAQ